MSVMNFFRGATRYTRLQTAAWAWGANAASTWWRLVPCCEDEVREHCGPIGFALGLLTVRVLHILGLNCPAPQCKSHTLNKNGPERAGNLSRFLGRGLGVGVLLVAAPGGVLPLPAPSAASTNRAGLLRNGVRDCRGLSRPAFRSVRSKVNVAAMNRAKHFFPLLGSLLPLLFLAAAPGHVWVTAPSHARPLGLSRLAPVTPGRPARTQPMGAFFSFSAPSGKLLLGGAGPSRTIF